MTCKCEEDHGRQVEAIIGGLDRLRAALAPSDQAVVLRAARAVAVGNGAGATARPTTSGGRWLGFSLRETSGGAAARVIFHAGSDATGPEIGSCNLAAGASDTRWFGPTGVDVAGGLFVEVAAGAAAGSVFLGAVD